MPEIDSTAVAGVEARGYRRGALTTDPWDQYVIPTKDRIESYVGRSSSFRIAGAAGTTGQRLFSMWNAGTGGVIVDLETVAFDVYQTAARVVEPPIARLYRVSGGTAPSGGAAMPKVAMDTAQVSSGGVTLLQGASAEKASTPVIATTPALTAANLITQEPVARALTLTGYEQYDRTEFINDNRPVTLRTAEGVVLFLDYSVATSNPVTDMYVVTVRWCEYTRP